MKTCGTASTNQSSSSTANACHSSIHPLHPIAYTTTLNFLPFENCHQSPNRKKITLNCDLLLFLKLQNFYFRRRYFELFLARSQLLMRNHIKIGNHGGHGCGGGLPPGYWDEQGGRKAAAEAKKKRDREDDCEAHACLSQLRSDSATDAVVVSSVLVEKDDAFCPFGKAVGSAALHLAGADDLCPPCRAGAQSWPLSSSTAAKFLHALTKSEGRGMHLLLLFIEGGWYGPTWVR